MNQNKVNKMSVTASIKVNKTKLQLIKEDKPFMDNMNTVTGDWLIHIGSKMYGYIQVNSICGTFLDIKNYFKNMELTNDTELVATVKSSQDVLRDNSLIKSYCDVYIKGHEVIKNDTEIESCTKNLIDKLLESDKVVAIEIESEIYIYVPLVRYNDAIVLLYQNSDTVKINLY